MFSNHDCLFVELAGDTPLSILASVEGVDGAQEKGERERRWCSGGRRRAGEPSQAAGPWALGLLSKQPEKMVMSSKFCHPLSASSSPSFSPGDSLGTVTVLPLSLEDTRSDPSSSLGHPGSPISCSVEVRVGGILDPACSGTPWPHPPSLAAKLLYQPPSPLARTEVKRVLGACSWPSCGPLPRSQQT